MLNPFDSPLGNQLVRLMAETSRGTVVFNQGQSSYQPDNGGGSGNTEAANCFAIASNSTSSLSRVYNDSANNYSIYRLEVYAVSEGQTNYGKDAYYWLAWDNATDPSSLQKSNYIKYFRQKGHSIPDGCTVFTNPGFTELGSSMQRNGWETFKTQHESQYTGCTDSNSPNYNAGAFTLDNSCQAYVSDSNYYTYNSQTFGDGYRFEGKIVEKRRKKPNYEEFIYESTIMKVCKYSSKCGTRQTSITGSGTGISMRSFEVGSNGFADNSSIRAFGQQQKDAMKARIDQEVANYVPTCTLSPMNPTIEKKERACDGRKFETRWTRFTSSCDGSVEKIVCKYYDNGTVVRTDEWLKSSGISSNTWKMTIPADPKGRAGYGGQNDYLKTLREDYEATLPPKPSSLKFTKRSVGSYPVVGDFDKAQLLVIVDKQVITTDGCGRSSIGSPVFYAYTYVYTFTPDSQERAKYGGLDETSGLPIVEYNGADYPPTATFGPFNDIPTKEDLIGTVVNGCTDPNAENYDSNANTDDRSCKYPATEEGDGEGDGDEQPTVVSGCTDSLATNYNSNATVDDGSCDYDNTKVSPFPVWILPVSAVALLALVVKKQ